MRWESPPREFGDWITFAIFLCEGPMGTAACVSVLLGYPHGHPLVRGALIAPALLWFVVGWVMTLFVIFDHPWTEK